MRIPLRAMRDGTAPERSRALTTFSRDAFSVLARRSRVGRSVSALASVSQSSPKQASKDGRSEERRVGKECVSSVDLGGRRIIKKKQTNHQTYRYKTTCKATKARYTKA